MSDQLGELVMKVKLNQKTIALGAAGLVLLSGATVTSLAAWTDTEWVNGGVSTTPSVSSSTFDVEQNVTASANSNWTNGLSSPGGVVDFGTEAASLTPGTSVVGFVRLRTIVDSVGGTLTLVHGASTGGAFLAALRYGAWLHPDASTCTASDYDGAGFTELVPDGSTIGTDSVVPFTLAASADSNPGTEQTVCFRLTFPPLGDPTDKSLQGQTADPIWQFTAISN
jgi:predicted ribosomally synthesized peptide with SipW-like signal peptide